MINFISFLAHAAPNQGASDPHLPASCPWQGLAEYGAPNVKWCEERLCSWINEPANTWSNLAYIFVAIFLYLTLKAPDARDGEHKMLPASALNWFPSTILIVGGGSFVYHASNTYITQMLDFFGMYLFCFLLLLLNIVRLRWLQMQHFAVAFFGATFGLTALTALIARFGLPIQGFVSILTLGIIVTELLYRRQARTSYSQIGFWLSFALLIAGAVCSASDVSRKWCDPSNHFIQGHAVWHVLSALSLLAASYHYRQFATADAQSQAAR